MANGARERKWLRPLRERRRIRRYLGVFALAVLAFAGARDGLSERTATAVPRAARQAASELRKEALERTGPLKKVKVPKIENFEKFVRDRGALRTLGKALFWDQQLGSDRQSCASCHYHAGADNRSKNQLDPGLRDTRFAGGDTAFSPPFGPNYQLTAGDFPFHKLSNPEDSRSVISDTNDIASSQGVFNRRFTGVPWVAPCPAGHADCGTPDTTGVGVIFSWMGSLVRNVEPRNTPTTINAVFNHRNFWDSRARNEFNGVNPIGRLDPDAKVVRMNRGNAELITIRIPNASAASQADGPPLSEMEMSFFGRRFPEVGRKMLNPNLVALGLQLVAKDDSELGPFSNQRQSPGATGITYRASPSFVSNSSYANLIRRAFRPEWWDGRNKVVDISGTDPVTRTGTPGAHDFTVMEYNFTLYFGLAIQEYESLLIADDSRFDRFMESESNLSALTHQEQEGLRIFLHEGHCINCHSGPELTGATVSNVRNELLERMIMGNDEVAVYDNGHYNIGVRPTADDLGIGATIGPKNLPLSNTRLFQDRVRDLVARLVSEGMSEKDAIREANERADVPRIKARPAEASKLLRKAAALVGNPGPVLKLLDEADATPVKGKPGMLADWEKVVKARDLLAAFREPTLQVRKLLAAATSLLPDPIDPGDRKDPKGPPLQPEERVAVDGAFKVPTVRGTELTAPYFHNGGQATLEQVVQFYNRGGDFARENRLNLDPDIEPLGLDADEQAALVAFLKATTDERVRYEQAPFDHPSLEVPNGGTGITYTVDGVSFRDDRISIPAVGRRGTRIPLGTANTSHGNFLQPLTP